LKFVFKKKNIVDIQFVSIDRNNIVIINSFIMFQTIGILLIAAVIIYTSVVMWNKFNSTSSPPSDSEKIHWSDQMHLTLFKSDGCPHCRSVKENFQNMQKIQQGSLTDHVHIVDKTNRVMMNAYKIQAFPTILMSKTKLDSSGDTKVWSVMPSKLGLAKRLVMHTTSF